MNKEVNKLREVQISILIEVVRICKENNLRYFLVGGTALGAVRHKGFIPWDDDIDIALPREDYKKLINLCKDNLDKQMFLQTYNTDKEYPYLFSKVRANNTVFLQTALKELNIHHGIYIDIFPLDGCSNNSAERIKQLKIINRYQTLLRLTYGNLLKSNDMRHSGMPKIIRSSIKNLIRITLTLIYPKEKIRRKIENLVSIYKYEESEMVINYFGAWGEKEVVPKRFLAEGIEKEFEGHFFNIPKEYHEYLTCIYGNYMKLPPEDKRVSHHGVERIQIGI